MKKDRREILICRDPDEVSLRAAELFARLADEAVSSTGRFAVALSGGSTPRALYTLLAGDPFRSRIPWSKVHLFWGDERCVPPDHPESNYRMVRETLLNRVPLPGENVHRMPAEQEDPNRGAAEYEQALKEFFGPVGASPPTPLRPRFDLILLGMGEDGHTASLFPGTAVLEETERLVTATDIQTQDRLPLQTRHRLTLTVPVINNAAQIVFLICGGSKASVLKEVLEGDSQPKRLPSQLIQPRDGKLLFIVDRAAASLLV